jgi:hypothetical protein
VPSRRADSKTSHLNTNDLHDLLRSFAHLSGTLVRQADGGLEVCLQPPDIPLSAAPWLVCAPT